MDTEIKLAIGFEHLQYSIVDERKTTTMENYQNQQTRRSSSVFWYLPATIAALFATSRNMP
jgi:hypothetical protein